MSATDFFLLMAMLFGVIVVLFAATSVGFVIAMAAVDIAFVVERWIKRRFP